ncbi:PAS domain S-box protein [Phenylobacterium sp.]|uniref:PAS domain S-box protein n=1 Tax=Phenylobacterium sp. TaxID=1871053 RepID=UPI001223E61E|nr:PAS domain S-box protein [Phenylobacterium sp.]THD54641.1 MAG: PAS domain S-box protein [Phenylobacterium sp.]
MSDSLIAQLRHLAALWLFGVTALAATTWVCFQLGLGFEAASFSLLIVIVFLSLMDSLISSVVFSLVAVVGLDYYFVPPLFTPLIFSKQDLWALATFIVASLVITSLVRRTRRLADTVRDRARLLDLTHDSVFVRNLGGEITYWNHGAEQLYGWRNEEAIGKVAHDLLQTVFPLPFEEISHELLASGHWEGELVHTKRDGSRATVASRWSLQTDERGQRIGTLETNSDITERKRAEESLTQIQAAHLTEAQRMGRTGSWSLDMSSGVMSASPELFRIFGLDAEKDELTQDFVLKSVHPDDHAFIEEVMRRRATTAADYEYDFRIVTAEGTIRHLHSVSHPVLGESGVLVGYFGTAMDTTERKHAEEALRQAHDDLARVSRVSIISELTASLAHEIIQPISAAVANARAAQRWLDPEAPDLEEARAAVAAIVSNGTLAAEIVSRTRRLFERGALQGEVVEVNDIIREAVQLLSGEAARQAVSIRTFLESTPEILADRVQLQQVVVNLVLNAFDALKEVDGKKEVAIRSQLDGEQVMVSVSDTGEGLPPEMVDRLFETFFTTKPRGTGMGLSISRSIITAHGGRLWAEPNNPRGATFQFALPILPQQPTG